ncbi:transcriptional repressor CTCF-like isoform X2 [Maniola jurtina]|uniref:transcriptional repressor CTCF-like isoform X2 n=1 Tax=Maniola jurtina TaxID=191418 RepID=UPI001E688218|nr:transcriptional repressor CTCF-like isoform X2 [Maniola jurtina]
MAGICCVDGCDPTAEDVTYFKFPNSRTLRRKWLDAINNSVKVTLDTAVCSRHFLPNQYEVIRGKKRLKAKVVPSVFDNITKPTSPQKEKTDSSDGEDSVPLQKVKSVATDNTDTGQSKQSPDHRLEDRQDSEASVRNGVKEDDIVKRKQPDIVSITDSESNKDIEDIITHYQIKQIRPLHKPTDRTTPDMSIEIEVPLAMDGEMEIGRNREMEMGRNGEIDDVIDVDEEAEPVFIEVAVGKGGGVEETTNEDCMMLLESVQCEVDPSCLMFPPEDPGNDPGDDAGNDSDVIDLGEKKEDPVSLLTSSDEDEVIIEEPKYDMVEVSDETDEDDVPLVRLVDKPSQNKFPKNTKNTDILSETNLTKLLWGRLCEYYCLECRFTSTSNAELRKHMQEHSTQVIQVCEICSYTTSSKHQYIRHKRKHKEDKRFKCHLCKYSARHNMSLIYHLKSHDNGQFVSDMSVFKCEKCNFETDYKVSLMKHIRICSSKSKRYSCAKCSYETDRRSDLKRHKARKHNTGKDGDYEPPAWVTRAKKPKCDK